MTIDINLDWDDLDYSGQQEPYNESVAVADALVLSIRERHRVDMPYIARLACVSEDEAAAALDGAVFLDPETDEWELAGVYLSGDLGSKLDVAREAQKTNAYFERNVKALEATMPPWIPSSEIYAAFGSPWIPEDVVLEFIHHIMPASSSIDLKILHDCSTGSWNIKGKSDVRFWPGSVEVWGTKRVPALDLLEDSLNGRDVRVYDEVDSPDSKSGVKHVLNHADTMEALDKQRRMSREFSSRWLWADEERKKRLEGIFNRRYRTFAIQRFDGSCLEFPGMSPEVKLRPYQRDSVMRILLRKSVLLAHDVGAGKTYEMIAAGMELRRIDPNEKVLYVVPNNVLVQWADLFAQMYPQADVLVVHPKSFSGKRRQAVLANVRDGNYDAVIMAQSSFDLVPISKRFRLGETDARIAELDEALADPARATTGVKVARSGLVRRRDKLLSSPDNDGLSFDMLGVTRLFVDEAHNYRNLSTGGRTDVQGMNSKGSKKCDHMLDAVRCTMRVGGGVVFATGTVCTNSIANVYTFQRYLQPFTLSALDLEDFDAWCGMFAQKRTAWEIDVDTSMYRLTTSFSGWGNLEILSSVLGYVADFHHMAPGEDLPECDGREDVVVDGTAELAEYLRGISVRVDRVRRGLVRRSEDNLLKICSDARRASLDLRLVDEKASPGFQCKVWACASEVARIWRDTAEKRLTQLVFCDISTPCEGSKPRESFNVYDALKQTLVTLGVPKGEIAFVHDATTEFARSRLFEAVRAGRIRVLVGSTPKLGIGVNIQDRLVAAHNLDVPWRPDALTQRDGRILRFGNMNPKVRIYRYVTEGWDAYAWQIVERKQRIIDELLSGTYEGGWMESDVGEIALSYGEIKALALGNPMLRERVEVANELERARILQRRAAAARARLVEKVSDIENAIERVEAELAICSADVDFAVSAPECDLTFDERVDLGADILKAVKLLTKLGGGLEIRPYRGFRLLVPEGADPAHLSLLLVREGRWPVDLGEGKERGVLIRLDNAIKGLTKHRDELAGRLEVLRGNLAQAKLELSDSGDDLADEVERLQARLSEIDMQLEEEALNKEPAM